jgi:hypothetical protein
MKRSYSPAGALSRAIPRGRDDYQMCEDFYGFSEKPFSLMPDPKYLYKSESHANAFDLLQYAIRRREGFVVVTGDIGTGKTTLCRAILDQLDQRTFTALVLKPLISEEDLFRLILKDFGVVSREEVRSGRLAGVTKQELINTLNDFLLSLQPLGASALLIVDEAQNLPMQVLEQIRLLSNLETDKEAAADRPRRTAQPADDPSPARAASARSARVDPLSAQAAHLGRNGRICGASADDCGRRVLGRLHAASPPPRARVHGRHSAADQPVVRPGAPGGLFRSGDPD